MSLPGLFGLDQDNGLLARESGGVGLGLTIAKTNIEADGGTLVLRNRDEGGLCAEISLPGRVG